MKYVRILAMLPALLLFGCSTLEVAERPDGDSSLIMAYFKPPKNNLLKGAVIATFVEGSVGKFLAVHTTADGLVYAENVPPGRYYIREVDLYRVLEDEAVTVYFGPVFSPTGFEDYSFTVEKNQVVFAGAYSFQGAGLGAFGIGGVTINPYHEVTKKDCIEEILKLIKAPSWRARLGEELTNLNQNQ